MYLLEFTVPQPRHVSLTWLCFVFSWREVDVFSQPLAEEDENVEVQWLPVFAFLHRMLLSPPFFK